MFNTARAALIASKAPVPPEVAKTHSGLISAFSLHLVADYKGDPIEVAEAQWAVKQSRQFVAQIATTFFVDQA